ncbi:MAG: ABC transporter permease [Chloroflexi bacterium]|nr:ABC transporter permease [Chloroflexota bacterium]MDA1239567.1 ABC transporter permease [Chloroflexota bacterium]
MQTYMIRRLVFMVPTLLFVTVAVFSLIRVMPGDYIAAQMGESRGADAAFLAMLREELGLNEPAPQQYVKWMGGIMTGDWGTSYWQNKPVTVVIRGAMPASLQLGLMAIIIGVAISVPIGVISAVRQDTPIDYIGRMLSIAGASIPNFFLATIIIIYGARLLGWFPPQGYQNPLTDPWGNLQQFGPGAFVLGTSLSAQNMRMIRTTMLETLRADYVRTARAKGLREGVVIFRHAFRNALIPVVTLLGFQIISTVGGSVLVEQVLGINGIGRNFIGAVTQRDYPLVQGILLVIILTTLMVNLMIDLSYSWLDPRIRY